MASKEGLLCDTIKDLLKDELTLLRDEQAKFQEAQEAALKEIQDLSGKLIASEREVEQLKENFTSFKQEVETSTDTSRTQVTSDVKAIEERLDKFEKQAAEDSTKFDKTLIDLQPKIDESLRLVTNCDRRTDEFDRMMRDLSRQCEEFTTKVKASEETVKNMDSITNMVKSAQEALEDSVTRKYNLLWDDVLNAIKEAKFNHVEAVQQELSVQREASKTETRSLVNYALNFMAQAHGERRQNAINRSLLTAWKEQTWVSARRRLGISYLSKILQKRHRVAFDTWHRRHTADALCDRLHGQYTDQLKIVYKDMDDKDRGLATRCDKLTQEVGKLDREKASSVSLFEQIDGVRTMIVDELRIISTMKSTLDAHECSLQKHEDWNALRIAAERDLRERIESLGQKISVFEEGSSSFAKSEDVNGMIRDILMIWNSIKQLDTAKADKKDVDNFALETLDRDKLSSRKLEDLESDFSMRSRQETLKLQEKWTEYDGRLEESARQFRHWEHMWEKLSGLVEDLVGKIGDLQQAHDCKAVSAHPSLRTPGRDASRSTLTRSRAEIPTLPGATPSMQHDSSISTQRGQRNADGLDPKSLWLNSAKGIVDATVDQAVSPSGTTMPRTRSRPRSASVARKPHDRRM